MLILSKENYLRISQLESLTKFNYKNQLSQIKIKKINLYFNFKYINFKEKKIFSFFLTLELISNQKCFVIFSKKSNVQLNIRKDAILGCKVTLRNNNMYLFLDYLFFALLKYEKFIGISFNKLYNAIKNTYIFTLKDLFIFFQTEMELDPLIKYLQISIIFNTNAIEQKLFLLNSFNIPVVSNKNK
jgi:large subunit ribosomal protein L5